MKDIKCVVGCKHFTGGEIKHHEDCPYYPESMSKIYDDLKSEVKNLRLANVSGMLPLTENAKEKLEYINGNCIARNFPNEQPTKQWAGAVLDLLEELGLGNYR